MPAYRVTRAGRPCSQDRHTSRRHEQRRAGALIMEPQQWFGTALRSFGGASSLRPPFPEWHRAQQATCSMEPQKWFGMREGQALYTGRVFRRKRYPCEGQALSANPSSRETVSWRFLARLQCRLRQRPYRQGCVRARCQCRPGDARRRARVAGGPGGAAWRHCSGCKRRSRRGIEAVACREAGGGRERRPGCGVWLHVETGG